MAYQVKNGRIIKTSTESKSGPDEVGRLVIIGEDEYMICDWGPKQREQAAYTAGQFMKDLKIEQTEFKGTLVTGLGTMLDTGRGEDQANIAMFSAMYASLCQTPNQVLPGQKSNTSAVFILRGKSGYVSRWAGRFDAKSDDQALSLAWSSLDLMRDMFKLDDEFQGRSPAYDRAIKMFKS